MIDLSKFCGDDADRENITSPWSAGDYTYATNGRILVRVLRRTDATREDGPDVRSVYAKAGKAGVLVPLPSFDLPPSSTCATCVGVGLIVDCETCGGGGESECHACGHSETCEDCGGGGCFPAKEEDDDGRRCDACLGEGVEYARKSIKVAENLYINVAYALWLRELPKLRIDLTPREEGDERPIHFTFDGGDGLLMPMRSSDMRAIIIAEGVDAGMADA